jgi:hypothetical protein
MSTHGLRRNSLDFMKSEGILDEVDCSQTDAKGNIIGNSTICTQEKTEDGALPPTTERGTETELGRTPGQGDGDVGTEQGKGPVATLSALQTGAPMAAVTPGATLNRQGLNARGFQETEVVLKLSASLNQLARGEINKAEIAMGRDPSQEDAKEAVLAIGDNYRGFEPQNADENKPRTKMHIQGNIYLTEVHNRFPCSMMLSMGEGLRGSRVKKSTTNLGAKGAYTALPNEHKSFEDKPRLLVESDFGKMTDAYVRNYPSHLNGESLMKDVEPVSSNADVWMVPCDSPIVDVLNSARAVNGVPEIVADETAKRIGKIVVDKTEVHEAVQQLESCLDGEVNYVPLYDAFKIHLNRPFYDGTGENAAVEAWTDTDELEVKSKGSDNSLDKVFSIHVRAIVEHRPHDYQTADEQQ